MSREIKFRGKRLDNGEWVYGYFSVFPKDGEIKNIITYLNEEGKYKAIEIDPTTLGQLVGIKNEFGFDIYDGDIIHSNQWNPTTYQVCFDRGAFYIAGSDKHEVADIKYAEQFKVIGNIYENPELLNKTTNHESN